MTKSDIQWIPIHDASFESFELKPREDGRLDLNIIVLIHPDELNNLKAAFGLESERVYLLFRKCWQFVANIYGISTIPEKIDDLIVESDSKYVRQIKANGLALNADINHYKVTFSDGSSFEVLAESSLVSSSKF